jgi:hypothetical protein
MQCLWYLIASSCRVQTAARQASAFTNHSVARFDCGLPRLVISDGIYQKVKRRCAPNEH